MTDQLQTLVQESQLNEVESKALLEQFQDAADLATEWEEKAKAIVVTDESQTASMATARVGRLALRDKRIKIDKTRKYLKEDIVRKGRAIDKIARYLKDLIEPTEKYLESQEKFVELKEAAEAEEKRLAGERLLEEKRLADEKRLAEEAEKARLENIELKKQADERDRIHRLELAKKQQEADDIQKKADEELHFQRKKDQAKQREKDKKARLEREVLEADQKKKDEEARLKQEQIEKEKLEAEQRLESERKAALGIQEVMQEFLEKVMFLRLCAMCLPIVDSLKTEAAELKLKLREENENAR